MNIINQTRKLNQSMLNDGCLILPKDIMSPLSLLNKSKKIYDDGVTCGLPTEWNNFAIDAHLGNYWWTIMPGEQTIVGGITGVGKTTFLDSIITHTIMKYNWKWAIFSPESGNPEDMHRRLVENFTGKTYTGRYGTQRLTWKEIEDVTNILNNFVFYLNPEEASVDGVVEQVEFLYQNFGLNAYVIDPYNEFTLTMPNGINENHFVSNFLTKTRKICSKYGLHSFLVAHPTKQGTKGPKGEEKIPDIMDFCGASNFANKVHNVLMLHREKDKTKNPHGEMYVLIKKVKTPGVGQYGAVRLYYDYRTNKLVDVPTVNWSDTTPKRN